MIDLRTFPRTDFGSISEIFDDLASMITVDYFVSVVNTFVGDDIIRLWFPILSNIFYNILPQF